MRIHLNVDDALIRDARKLEDGKTSSEIAAIALQECVQRRKQLQIIFDIRDNRL